MPTKTPSEYLCDEDDDDDDDNNNQLFGFISFRKEGLQPQKSLSIIRLTFLCRSPESPVQEDAGQEENAAIDQLHGDKGQRRAPFSILPRL